MPNREGAFFSRLRARVGGVILLTPEPRRTIQGSIQRRTAGAGVWIGGGEPVGVYPPPAGAEAARRAARRGAGARASAQGGSGAGRRRRRIDPGAGLPPAMADTIVVIVAKIRHCFSIVSPLFSIVLLHCFD